MNFDNFTAINGITESIAGVAYWNGKYYLSSKYHDSSSGKDTNYFYIYSEKGSSLIGLNTDDLLSMAWLLKKV